MSMTFPVSQLTLGALLGASLYMLVMIYRMLIRIHNELVKRNFIQELTNQVMEISQEKTGNSAPTKTTAPYGISNPPDVSGQQSSSR